MYSENDEFEDYNDNNQNDNNNGSFMDKAKEFYQNNKTICLVCAGVLLLLLVLLMVNSCSGGKSGLGGKNNDIEIVMNEQETLGVGNTLKLNAEIKGVDSEPNYSWSSSDESVVKVDQLGNVTALKLGNANVTISVDVGGEKYTATTSIVVAAGSKDVIPTDVSFPEGELLITVGDKYQLLKQVTPSNGYITNVVYTSGNTSIVEVSETGEVKAKKVGVTKVKMSVNNDEFVDELVVNVVGDNIDPTMIVNPETIMFDDNSVTMIAGENKILAYQYLPTSAYVEDLMWSSSDEQVVTVSSSGEVTAVKEGTAVVTVKTRNNLTDTIAITVENRIVNVTALKLVTSSNVTMNLYETATIIAEVLPNDATDKSLTYTSSNQSAVTVDNNGLIRAVGVGTSAITVKTNDRGLTKVVNVTVRDNTSPPSPPTPSTPPSTCTVDEIFRNVVNSHSELSESTSGGTVVTANEVIIDTSNIGSSSCGAVSSIKYGYSTSGSACAATTSVNRGDDIVLNMPSGSGIMSVCLKVILDNGNEYNETYYIKYNVSAGTSTCTADEIFENVVNSHSELSESTSGGTVVTANEVIIDTLNIGSSSCGAVSSIKYGYSTSGSSCAATTSVTHGNDIVINMPSSGSGTMPICLEVMSGGVRYSKTYYIRYNRSAGSVPENLTVDLRYDFFDTAVAIGRGKMYLGHITIVSNVGFDSFKYCIGNGDGTECVPDENASPKIPKQGYGDGDRYLAIEQNTTYTKSFATTRLSTLYTASWVNQNVCFIIRSAASGDYSDVKCVTVKK